MISNLTITLAHAVPWLSLIVVKATILLLATTALTRLMRNRSAALRHFLHSAAMTGLLVLPFAALLLPSLRLPVLPPALEGQIQGAPAVLAEHHSPIAPQLETKLADRRDATRTAHEAGLSSAKSGENSARAPEMPVKVSSAAARKSSALGELSGLGAVVLLWMLGSAFFLFRMIWMSLRLHALVNRAVPVEAITLGSRLRWLCRDIGIDREVVLLASSELDVPIAAGVLSPKIILSPQSSEWSETRRRAVLCHELAHVKRLDALTQLIAAVTSALYWFHPLVWITVRAMRAERERACDDYVLAFGTAPSDYAHELLEIVSAIRRPQPAAALAMARPSQLEGRVLALLNPRVRHGTLPAGVATLVSVALFALALPLAAARFEQRPASLAPVIQASSPAQVSPATTGAIAVGNEQAPEPAPEAPAAPVQPALAPGVPHEPISAAQRPGNFEFHSGSSASAAPFDCFEGKSAEHTNISSHTDDNGDRTWSASWSGTGCSIEAHSAGSVRFNAEATAIESISSGGYFEINQRIGDNLRRLRIEPSAQGQLEFVYKVNGAQQEFDSGARAWLASLLLQLERATGFNASMRVPALLAKGGPEAVLSEIENLKSDYVRQLYFIKLFENASLPGPLLVKALEQARNEISTDYSLAQVLLTIAQKYELRDEAQRTAFLNGASKLRTDYEHARVLIELLKRPNLSPQLVEGALESAKSIRIDYEKSRILTTLAGFGTFDESEISTYLGLASAITTDYEHSRSLMALMEHQKLSSAAVSQILKSASTIGTDYEKSRILLALSGSNNFDEKQIATYLTLVDSIGTDYERSRDLIALMQGHKLGSDSVARIIAETQKIGTDYEKARVLTEAASRYQLQGPVREAYIKAANSIGTEYERNRTLAAIVGRETI